MKTNSGVRWRTGLTAGAALLVLCAPATAEASGAAGHASGTAVFVTVGIALALLLGSSGAFLLSRRSRRPRAREPLDVVLYTGGSPPDGRERPARVLGYASIGAPNVVRADEELEDQAARISGECERRGWPLLELVREAAPRGDHGLDRPGLAYALGRVAAGEATVLMVSELSRLTSSPGELESFLERLASDEARLVVARGSVGRTEKRGALGARRGVRPLVVGVRARRGQKGRAVSTH